MRMLRRLLKNKRMEITSFPQNFEVPVVLMKSRVSIDRSVKTRLLPPLY